MPYEKVGKNEPVCIADEVPFEIPDSWEWARLKNLVIKEIKRGKSPKYASDGSVYVFAQKCNVKLGEIDISLAKFLDMRIFEKYPVEEYMVDEDIIINSTGNGTLGRIGMFRDSDRINDSIIVPDSHVTIIRACNQLKKDYLFYVLKYYQPFLEKLGEGSTNQTELRPSTIAELFIPIPPIKEQEQIVTKLLEVIPMVDLYGKKENSNVDINTDEKILQLNERINIKGQNKSTGEEVQIETFDEKVVLNSDSIAIFYQFEKSEDIVTSGIKDIEVVMKNGETYDLWNECDDKTMSYDEQEKKATTYIVFSKPLVLQEVEKIKVYDKYLDVP